MPKYYEAYEIRYRQVHGKNLSWASDNPSPIVEEILKKYIHADHARILDIGCGEGRDCRYLLKQGYDVQAVDISEEAVHYCRDRVSTEEKECFHVLDVCTDSFEGSFDYIYSVATLHMLVLPQDRKRYLSFIKEHLRPNGYALILIMGDGTTERETDITEACENQTRVHQETGTQLQIAATSCKIVSFPTFRKELITAGFQIKEEGLTEIQPDFPVIMYAVVQIA